MDIFTGLLELVNITEGTGKSTTPAAKSFVRIVGLLLTLSVLFAAFYTNRLVWLWLLVVSLPMCMSRAGANKSADAVSPDGNETAPEEFPR